MTKLLKERPEPDWLVSRFADLSILLGIVVIAAVLRFSGIDHGSTFHPDERHMIMVTTDLDANGMNPKSFAYGSFSFYAVWVLSKACSGVWELAGGHNGLLGSLPNPTSYDGLFYIGRFFCLCMGLLAIPLIYYLAVILYRRSIVGLIAAAFLATNVFHLQLSRFFTSDVTLTTLALIAVIALVRAAQTQHSGWFIAFGVALGVATATKISSAFLVVPLAFLIFLEQLKISGLVIGVKQLGLVGIGAVIIAAISYGVFNLTLNGQNYAILGYNVPATALLVPALIPYLFILALCSRRISIPASKAFIGLALGTLTFILLEPFAILDFNTFTQHTREQTGMVQGLWRPPYTIQYAHTTPYFYHLKQMLWYTMGAPVFVLCCVGIVAAIFRSIINLAVVMGSPQNRQNQAVLELIPFLFLLVYFAATAKFQVKFPRYLLPLYPLCFLFAAQLFWSLRLPLTMKTEKR